MPALEEKTLSWALYHPCNSCYLHRILELMTGETFREVIPICRELPIISEVKSDYTVAGYATGWRIEFIDLLVMARAQTADYLIIIEVKRRVGRNSGRQALKYVGGLLTTLFPTAHHPRGALYQFYADQIFTYKNCNDTLQSLRNSQRDQPIHLVAAVIAEHRSRRIQSPSPVRYTPGLQRLSTKYRIILPKTPVFHYIQDKSQLITNLVQARAEAIQSLYSENKAIIQATHQALHDNKVIRFTTTENQITKLFIYPNDEIVVNNGSHAYRYSMQRLEPLELLQALDTHSGGRFYLQFFLNGINNPVLFLQIGADQFLSLQHNNSYQLHHNGIFNEYIATDAKPITTTPEAGDVICLMHGKYRIQSDPALRGTARQLTLNPDAVFPKHDTPPQSLTTTIVSPRVKKARYENSVRPFLSNREAQAAVINPEAIFQYDNSYCTFICTGIRMKYTRTS